MFSGPCGLLAGFRNGSIWIDHSTTDYKQNFGFKAEMDKLGAHILEAPVTGGYEALEKGKMTALVAGEKDIFDEAIRPKV